MVDCWDRNERSARPCHTEILSRKTKGALDKPPPWNLCRRVFLSNAVGSPCLFHNCSSRNGFSPDNITDRTFDRGLELERVTGIEPALSAWEAGTALTADSLICTGLGGFSASEFVGVQQTCNIGIESSLTTVCRGDR